MGVVQSEMQLIVIAGLIFLLKVVLMPAMLYRVVRDAHVSERLATYVRPTTLSFIAVLAISFSAFVGLHLPFGNDAFALSIALALALIGFEFLIVHKNLLGQGIGFLVLENGIFFFGLAVVGGVPFFVECGVMFDLLALFVLAIALIRRTQQAHSSVSTDFLTALNDL
jgi:hydrogenase-4 component E